MFVVFDLDGTLADVSHRVHFLTRDKPDWDAFYGACGGDAPIDHAISVFLALRRSQRHDIEIWTGRRESVRSKTMTWIRRQVAPDFDHARLRMRQDGDFRHDVEVKGEWLQHGVPDLIFEDRNSMVEFWRSRDIPCFQVALGDF